MNEMVSVDKGTGIADVRTPETIAAEIRTIFRQAQVLILNASIELGRRLSELKYLLPGSEFLPYCRREFGFSQSTTYNYIRVFNEYGAAQLTLFGAEAESRTLGRLSFSKALLLLAVPGDEREEFAEENKVEDLTVRELKELLEEREAERDRAQAGIENLQQSLKEEARRSQAFAQQRDKAESEQEEQARRYQDEVEKRQRLQRELDGLRSRPVEKETVVDGAAVAERDRRIAQLEQALAAQPKAARSETLAYFKGKLRMWETTTNDLLEHIAYGDGTDEEKARMKKAVLAGLAEVQEQIKEGME